jgi:glycyl-tRNA synthetase beta chain
MLQGQAGGYYAKKFGFPDEVVNAFNNQYKISLKTKSADLSVVLSLAQKIDGIFGFFSTKKKISGSGDPFGIRRTTISIIKILIENNLELDLYQLMQECQEIYKKQKLNFLKDLSFIQSFFNKRIEIFFAEIGYNQEIIRSNLKRDSFNPRVILEKIKSLKKFLDSESGKLFLKAFKRLSSIIDDVEDKGNIDESLFQKKEERNLYESIKVIKGKNKTYYKEIYEDIYSQISIQIDHFLDNVMVNDEDINVRKNRKLLLLECKKVLNLNFNFSVLGN